MRSPEIIPGNQRVCCSGLPKEWIAWIASEPCTEASDRTPEFLHDQSVSGVTQSGAAVLFQIWREQTQRTHSGNELLRKFSSAMTRDDLRHDFFLHELARPIARRAFLIGE